MESNMTKTMQIGIFASQRAVAATPQVRFGSLFGTGVSAASFDGIALRADSALPGAARPKGVDALQYIPNFADGFDRSAPRRSPV